MSNTVAIILARGGSKGIPNKNMIKFCGKPLLVWSINHAKKAKCISSVWVSSDSKKILDIAKKSGANIISRPKKLSKDSSTSISGWIHAIDKIQEQGYRINEVIALQATSPVRESTDIEKGLKEFRRGKFDSMFSGSPIGDFFIWEKSGKNKLKSINYDFQNRQRRQKIKEQFVENGSFYIFKPKNIKKFDNQLSGKIGIAKMEFWKSFEIDDLKNVKFCEMIMRHYLLNNKH
jgi:CMP-N,N'-diacetyllegionaminic acid synthase